MREYSAQSVVLVLTVLAATAIKRERETEKQKRRRTFLEESRSLLSDPLLDPKFVRLTRREPDPSVEEWRRARDDAVQLFEEMEPWVRVLSERP